MQQTPKIYKDYGQSDGSYYEEDTVTHPPSPYGGMMEHVELMERFVAFLIDSIILFVIGLVVFIPAGLMNISDIFLDDFSTLFDFSFRKMTVMTSSFAIALLYFSVQEGGRSGATVGKKVVDIRVVDVDYQPIGMPRAFIRNLFRFTSLPIESFVLIIDAILIHVKDTNQRIGDIVADTYVVYAPAEMGYFNHPSQ